MDIEGSNSHRPIFRLISPRHPLTFSTFDIGERPMVADTPNPIRESGVTGLLFEGKPWNIYMKQATNSSTKEPNCIPMSHDAVLMVTFLNGLVSIDIPNLVLKEEFARIFHQRQKGCNKNFLVISNGLSLPVVQLQWLAQPNSNPAYQKRLVIGVLSLSVPCSCRRSKLARRSCLLLRFLLEQVEIEWIFA